MWMVPSALLTAFSSKKKKTKQNKTELSGAQKIFCRSSSENHVMKARPWAGAECFSTCAKMSNIWNKMEHGAVDETKHTKSCFSKKIHSPLVSGFLVDGGGRVA